MNSEEFKQLTVEQAVEAIAQMLYDRAEQAGRSEDQAITEEMTTMFYVEGLTYCAAAEYVRDMVRSR